MGADKRNSLGRSAVALVKSGSQHLPAEIDSTSQTAADLRNIGGVGVDSRPRSRILKLPAGLWWRVRRPFAGRRWLAPLRHRGGERVAWYPSPAPVRAKPRGAE